ncbi:alpha/beta fold hydrolase [uncultured Piscinibacter sp.]|uniref:alpha/beta fold hydrolase n=1 Tax=uncultured Piscinibacter sp. TaxID=1131835 RepID=UPI002624AC0C|nr:alpha/beta fold hydrolase [uncultured Piscinibacter sp.]
MLARLQQAITLSLLALAAAWALWFARQQRWGWALVGAMLVLFGYALFLGLEFVLLAWTRDDDPAPRASAAQLLRAWWGEARSAPRVFCWRQPFRSQAQPDFLDAGHRGRLGVVLVHGFVCNRGFWNPWLARFRAAGVPFVAVNLEPVFGRIDDYVGTVDDAVRRVREATGRAPLVVAHSMGGLAVRAWLSRCVQRDAVEHVVTIGSPHAGTWLARFGVTPNSLQMRRRNAWLDGLRAAERARAGQSPYAQFTCFYSHCDNIVFPPSTATLPGADNRHVPGSAHVHLADQPEVFAEVWARLSASNSGSPATRL